jgi:hypothetical protein
LNSEGIFDSGFSSSRCCALPPAPASADVPQPSFAARVTSHTEEQESSGREQVQSRDAAKSGSRKRKKQMKKETVKFNPKKKN